MIHNSKKILGLLGNNISYSISPSIHNFSAELLGLNYVYLSFDIPPIFLNRFLDFFKNMGGEGLNITTPYKTKIIPFINHLSSINTIYKDKSGLYQASSTDGKGLELALKQIGYNLLEFNHIIILGNGGASLGISEYIASRVNLIVLRRNKDKDKLFKTKSIEFTNFSPDEFNKILRKHNSSKTLIIQSTNAPFKGDDLSAFLVHEFKNFKGILVDLIYGKSVSSLYKYQVAKNSATAQDGLPMLIEQARLSQKYWWNVCAPYKEIKKHLDDL